MSSDLKKVPSNESDPGSTPGAVQLPDFLAVVTKVRTPLTLLALVTAVLGYCILQVVKVSSDAHGVAYTVLLTAVLLAIVAAATVIGVRGTRTATRDAIQYAVTEGVATVRRQPGRQRTFISAPMASVAKEHYDSTKAQIQSIRERLRADGQLEVYWGGAEVPSTGHWEDAAVALDQTVERIRSSDNFMLILPDYSCQPRNGFCKPSSVWWEVGMAIALNKACAFFIHEDIAGDEDRLPYYLKGVQQIRAGLHLPRMRLWKVRNLKDVLERINEAGGAIFPD